MIEKIESPIPNSRRAHRVTLFFGLFALVAIMSCDREFGSTQETSVEIIKPNPRFVQLESKIPVEIKSTADESIARIDVGAFPMSLDPLSNSWKGEIVLTRGLNRFVVRYLFEMEEPKTDTLFLFHLPFEILPGSALLTLPLGGHSTTFVSGVGHLILGGAPSASAQAEDRIFVLPTIRSNSLTERQERMVHARVGHSSTLLDSGQLLTLGGGSQAHVQSIDALIEEPEIFDFETGTRPLHVEGAPIRRMFHTASLRNTLDGPVIDIIGGTGDTQYSPEPLFGTRTDVRSFLIRNDTLISLSPAVGPFIERITGHAQVDLVNTPAGAPGMYYVTGKGGTTGEENVNILVDFRSPIGILVSSAEPLREHRYHHAAARIGFGLAGVFGGRSLQREDVLSTMEIFDFESGLTFLFPEDAPQSIRPRYLHTATVAGPNLILLAGGFDENFDAVDRIEYFSYDL